MDLISDKLEDIELLLLSIQSHSHEMTTANFTHHSTIIKGTSERCLENLEELKTLITCAKKK